MPWHTAYWQCGAILVACGFLGACHHDDQTAAQQSAVPTSRPAFAATSAPAPLPSLSKAGNAYKLHPEITRQTTASGLEIQDEVVGTGASPQRRDQITVEYTGWLADGSVFDTSRGKAPFSFALGLGQVIRGWDEGVATMKLGGKRILTIPPGLAYGDLGSGGIPPGATLVFEIELLDINGQKAAAQAPATQVGPPAPPVTQPATQPMPQSPHGQISAH